MLVQLVEGWTVTGAHGKHSTNKVPARGGHVFGFCEGFAFCQELFQVFGLESERETCGDKSVKANTERPNVALFSVFVSGYDFRGSVTRGSDKCFQNCVVECATESEVDEFHVVVDVKEHVFEFQIAMDEKMMRVNVSENCKKLDKDAANFGFVVFSASLDELEESSVGNILHEKEEEFVDE